MSEKSVQLYTALNRLSRQMYRFSHCIEHEQHHYREQSRLLQLIGQNQGILQRDLTEEMDVRPSSMTEMLAKMEQLGLITREQDQKNGRILHIFLTEQGRLAAEQAVVLTEKLTESMFECLGDDETDQLLRLTEKLCDHLDMAQSASAEAEAEIGHHHDHPCHRHNHH